MANTIFARQLRRTMTDAERRLWYHLRDRRLQGRKFRRQYPIGPYIADFVCLELALVLEIDGSQHQDSPGDLQRDGYLQSQGFRVLRFWNHHVLKETSAVLEQIRLAVDG